MTHSRVLQADARPNMLEAVFCPIRQGKNPSIAVPCAGPSGSEGQPRRRHEVMNSRSCGRKRLGRAVPFALAIALLASECSPEALRDSDAARPVKTMIVAAGGESHVRSFPLHFPKKPNVRSPA
jgi:hypothetical protein